MAHRNFIFSTNRYMPNSIKSSERQRRGISQRLILGGAATRRSDNFNVFLANEDNRRQLAELMLKVWTSPVAVSRLKKCKDAMINVEGRAYTVTYLCCKISAVVIHTLCQIFKGQCLPGKGQRAPRPILQPGGDRYWRGPLSLSRCI